MDFFDSAYQGTPPWDIGRPQKEFVELVRSGEITGSVLDIGCGTGEHALFFAAEGYDVWGIDSAPLAIEKAQEKAVKEDSRCIFVSWTHWTSLSSTGSSIPLPIPGSSIPSLMKTARSLWITLLPSSPPAGNYFMLCFSDLEPAGYGPRRITKREIPGELL